MKVTMTGGELIQMGLWDRYCEATETSEWAMIWRGRPRFDMCFQYGPEVEQERGKGRILRLHVTALDEPIHS